MNAAYLLKAVDHVVERDQDRSHRKHLGASLIGRECPRQLWYVFRWAGKEEFTGRMLRLFERGQLEEARFIELLRNAGATVYERDPNTGEQWRILDVDGHFGGSTDGVADNVPQLPPEMPTVMEMKTMNDKTFQKLKKHGVKTTKPEHYVQIQVYMHKLGIKVGLYMAVNKNDDELYFEFVSEDTPCAERALVRARSIIYNEEGPPRIANSAGRFPCTFCSFKEICHLNKVPEVNCRTCVHSTPGPEGTWLCAKGNTTDIVKQTGCQLHLFNPYLLNIVRVQSGDTADNWLELLRHDGTTVTTGPNHVPSDQLTI